MLRSRGKQLGEKRNLNLKYCFTIIYKIINYLFYLRQQKKNTLKKGKNYFFMCPQFVI